MDIENRNYNLYYFLKDHNFQQLAGLKWDQFFTVGIILDKTPTYVNTNPQIHTIYFMFMALTMDLNTNTSPFSISHWIMAMEKV